MISWLPFKSQHNLPNGLSFLRALIGAALPFLLLIPSASWHITAIVLFILGAWTDYWDGWIARRQGLVSSFGKILDPTSDKILILCPLATFAYLGFYSPWWLVPIFIREIVITFCRIGWLLENKAIGAEKLGKVKLVLQVVAVSAGLGLLISQDFPSWEPTIPFWGILTITLIILTNILTIVSGISVVKNNLPLFKSQPFAKFVSAAGVGLLPGPTGTWGSLFGLALVPLIAWNTFLFWGVTISIFVASYYAVKQLHLDKKSDPQFVVMDEVVGVLVTFMAAPVHGMSLAAGFFLFRIFDILKPFPCRHMERLHGFWGIMMDDVFAGIYAATVLYFVF